MTDQIADNSTLVADVLPGWTAGDAAQALSACVASGADARAMMRVAYLHARGWLTHLAVPSLEWESVYSILELWSNRDAMREVVVRIDGIRRSLDAFVVSGAVRDLGGLKAIVDVGSSAVVVTYMLAAIFRACKRRLVELDQATAPPATVEQA